MAEPKQSEELQEQFNLVEKLKELSADKAKHTAYERDLLITINNLGHVMTKRVKNEEIPLQHEKENIQKKIYKLQKELVEGIEAGNIRVDRARQLGNEIVKEKIKELDLSQQIADEEARKKAMTDFYNTVGLGKTIEFVKQLRELWKTHPMLAVLKVSGIILKDIFELFKVIDGAAADFRKNMGFVRDDTYDLEYKVRQTYFALANTGVAAKDLYESFQEISKAIGTSQATTMDMAKDMSLMSVSLGVAQTTSAEFSKTMGMMARNTMDSQKNMGMFVSRLSAAAGTNLNEVMSDVVAATKTSYQFLIKNPLALAKAAVEAKRMGTSITEAAKSAQSLINFTESVKAEMEASVLLGESINLQRARELSYRKDLAGLNKEILELATKARFEDLDPFQQEAVAKALGKSADELGKMLQADREMGRIRADGSLAKQVQDYDKLKNANESLARQTANSAREQLQLKSNLEATKAISVALKSIYQSMMEPLITLGAWLLPKIATGLSHVNQLLAKLGDTGKVVGIIASLFFVLASMKGIGKLVSWASGGIGKSVGGLFRGISLGVRSFGHPNVMKGAVGILFVAAALVPLAYALKLMQDVKWETFKIMAASLGVLTLAVVALGFLMGGAWELILAGAAAMVIIGVSLIPTAYAFKLFGQALELISKVDLMSIAGGLTAMVIPLFRLAMITPFLGAMAIGMTLFGLALRTVVGPVEKMGAASEKLGTGLDKAISALNRLSEIKIGDTLKQFQDLSETISNISKTISEIPDIKIGKLQDIIVKAGEMGTAQAQKSNEEIIAALKDVKLSIDAMRASLEKGGIHASVHLDSQRMDSAMARALAFKGTLSPQPQFA